MREFSSPDGRRWRVWAVRPDTTLAERRQGERRVTPIESLSDPPVLQRRRAPDRRVDTRRHRPTAADLLPARWRGGWLVFKPLSTARSSNDAAPGDAEVRRLAPIPSCWDGCSDADLNRHCAEAQAGRLDA